MSGMKSKVLTALPAFIATLGGLGLYVAADASRWPWAIIVPTVLGAVGYVSLRLGRRFVADQPVIGTVIMSGWVLFIIAAGAVLTAVIFWVGLELPAWVAGTAEPSEEVKELAKLGLGAATAFLAVVFTDDLDKAEGDMWPSTKTKEAFKEAFGSRFGSNTLPYKAVYEDWVAGDAPRKTIRDWGFWARLSRARIIQAAPPGTPPPPSDE
jgi:hypothetical protein